MANDIMRPIARYYDEHEHQRPTELEPFRVIMQAGGMGSGRKKKSGEKKEIKVTDDKIGSNVMSIVGAEELAWGDVGLMLALPGSGLGNAAIGAVATEEQFERFGQKYAAMAITEPGCGSDASAVTTMAVPDGDDYILNGEKIFVTDGDRCEVVVVWATLDKSKGRNVIKSFIVEKGTPGLTVGKLEHKCGIRASDTAVLILQDCRIPKTNILGDPEIRPEGGFKGVMATFDATRPLVGALALGCARAAYEFTKEALAKEGIEIRYDKPLIKLSAIEKDMLWMEAQLEMMRVIIQKAAWMADNGRPNNLETSMAKPKEERQAIWLFRNALNFLDLSDILKDICWKNG
jgi:acyl-CoA dehydrogenase